jgi:hypothetical protein
VFTSFPNSSFFRAFVTTAEPYCAFLFDSKLSWCEPNNRMEFGIKLTISSHFCFINFIPKQTKHRIAIHFYFHGST